MLRRRGVAAAASAAAATARPLCALQHAAARGVSVAAAAPPLRTTGNFFRVVSGLPRFGEGSRVKRATWRGEDCFWRVLTVKPNTEGRGRAWGMLTWDGKEGPREEITGTLKGVWAALDPPQSKSTGPTL